MGAGLDRRLAPLLARRWLLVGVGNDLRGDDAFGPLLARALARAGRPAIDAGPAPESFTGPILRHAPEVILFADAAEMGAAPGTLRLLPAEALGEAGGSTHDPSLRLLLAFLGAQAEFSAWVLAAQPAGREFGAAVSAEMREALREAEALFARPAEGGGDGGA